MLLFINACVRENSRTERLAKCLLEKLDQRFTEVRLEAISFPVTNEAYLTRRDQLIEAGDFSDPSFSLAHQFASADRIVIAAPYWDLSFPAALKQYFEHINVRGITFTYTPEGIPRGLCRAKEIYYVMTAGGFGYVRALAQGYYGIRDVKLIQAVGLDIEGADAELLLQESMENLT